MGEERGSNAQQQRWITTFMTTVGAVLVASLLLWIATTQASIITSQAVLQQQFQAQTEAFNSYNQADRTGDLEVKEWFKQIWPRLRVHGENVAILKRYMEDVCACEVELKKPERF